jgi:hypothetical protein
MAQLVEAGYIDRDGDGFCWHGVKEEKERQERQKTAYDEACTRIRRQIQEEAAASASSVVSSYDSQLSAIQREIDQAASEAASQRARIEKKISNLCATLDSLGFFQRKEKKELQTQIEELRFQRSKIPSRKDIEWQYNAQITRIKKERQTAVDRVTEAVKSKYIMPRPEDFSDIE